MLEFLYVWHSYFNPFVDFIIMEFSKIVQSRYATKIFDEKKISEDKIQELLEYIRLSPSSFNLQPWKFIVITDQDLKNRLEKVSWNQPQVSTCSHLIVMCADTDTKKHADQLEKMLIDSNIPKEKVEKYLEIVRKFIYGMNEEATLTWCQKQVYIALSNAMNGAKALGFDSCPMEGFSPKDYSEIINLPKNIVPTLVCPVGYANDKQMEKLRFKKEELFIRT